MNIRIRNGIMAVLLAMYALTPATVSAALMQHLHTSVDENTGYWGWGDFEATVEVCDGDCINNVEAFNFAQIVGENYELQFAKANIDSVEWAINDITWDIDLFHLTTGWVEATSLAPGTTQTIMGMMTFAANGQTPIATVSTCFDGTTTCGAQPVTYGLHFSHDMHGVPEPTTIALLSFGLVGLGFARRRMKAQQLTL